jgi:hypothetical protein
MPNELIAIKDPSNSRGSETTCMIPDSSDSISGFDFVKLIFGAINPVSKAEIALTRLHKPEVGSVCPIFDFTEPTNNGFVRPTQKVPAIVLHSIASPTTVAEKKILNNNS